MKVRVLSISHLYPTPNDEFKGLVVHQQMKELINLGHEVKVLSPIAWTPFLIRQMKQKWKAYSKIPEHIERDGIDIYYPRYLVFPKALFLASSGSRLYHEIKGLTDYIYKMFPFDLIHAHAALPDGYAAMLLAQEYRKPLVITFRATDVDITIHRSRKCFNAIHKVFEKSSKIIAE